jgi:NAD(P)-dependent dehydrogenase (short-subunit alcohol dehydrogenase family)
MQDFAGKVAVVTGAASGIGLALSRALARAGAHVVLTDVDAARVAEAAAHIVAEGGAARAERVDVTDAAAVHAVMQSVVVREGRIDYVFNNAGLGLGGEVREMDALHWERIVAVNLWGVIHGVQAAYPLLVRQRSGHLVNIASAAGLLPLPLGVAYAMTKHAVVGLSLSLRQEAEALGVRVTVVCPGFVQTEIFASAILGGPTVRWMVGRMPIQLYPVDLAAQRILAGVARNRAKVVFPLHAHVLVWTSRFAPWLMNLFMQRTLREHRSGALSAPPAAGDR